MCMYLTFYDPSVENQLMETIFCTKTEGKGKYHVQMVPVQVLNMSSLNPLWYHVTLEKFRLLEPNTTKAKSMKV